MLDVQADQRRVGQPSPGEFDQKLGQRGRKQQRLPALRQAAQNFPELLCKPQLVQPGDKGVVKRKAGERQCAR